MYREKEVVRKSLEKKVAQASVRPALMLKGETLQVTPQELLATLETMFGKKG